MVRVSVLRKSGVLFFAVLIGAAANHLQHMYVSGTLFERFNYGRKASLTILTVSLLGLITLVYFEFIRSKRRSKRQGFGSINVSEPPSMDGLGATCIYSTPDTLDQFEDRPPRSSTSRNRDWLKISSLWISLLRILCMVFPVVYLYTLVDYFVFWLPSGAGNLSLTILFPVLLLISVLSLSGILLRRVWGMNFGYALAIFHLLIFPIGTAVGLVMLVGLVGASTEFKSSARVRSRKARARRRHAKSEQKKTQTASL
jgi:hypothetical protein